MLGGIEWQHCVPLCGSFGLATSRAAGRKLNAFPTGTRRSRGISRGRTRRSRRWRIRRSRRKRSKGTRSRRSSNSRMSMTSAASST